MLVVVLVVLHRVADRQAFVVGDALEVVADLGDQRIIHVDRVAEVAEIADHRLRRRLCVAIGERRDRRLDLRDAELDRFDVHQRGQTRHAMAMELERCLGAGDDFLQRRYQRLDPVGFQ